MLPRPFEYHRPVALDAALDMLARPGDDAAPYAGGTELSGSEKLVSDTNFESRSRFLN